MIKVGMQVNFKNGYLPVNLLIMFRSLICLSVLAILFACNDGPAENGEAKQDSLAKGSFGYDRQFLSGFDSALVQLSNATSSVLVSAKYQGKVFTSTATGDSGQSFGWINYSAFTAPLNPHINAYGGENRYWLGPEGGKYSLYFKKGDKMIFDNWKTPAPIDTEPWQLSGSDNQSVTLQKDMSITNYVGHTLQMSAERVISLLGKDDVQKDLNIAVPEGISFVGYSTKNVLKNTSADKWNDKTGMPCIWILDMFKPSPNTTIVIPYNKKAKGKKVITSDYFGEIGKDRLVMSDSVVFFKADGNKRGKMGVLPQYVLPVAGSYDADNNVLTITFFDVDNKGKYLNQVWNTTNEVYSGDAMNAYNDGPLEDGTQLGPFYEIESVSPAAALNPGQSIVHNHNVYHFTGEKKSIDSISRKLLGVDLESINKVFGGK
jgi:hypothetical protein